ncbi:hypothetical protein DV736_g3585, partial [Chaetothyriales sp. CBS 134916]
MAPTQTRQWLLAKRPKEVPTYGTGDDDNLKLVTVDLPTVKDGQVLVKTLYLSNDPAQRGWMDDIRRLYVKPVVLNTPMRASGLGEVVESKSDKLKAGTIVSGLLNWTEYSVHDAKDLLAVPPLPDGLSVSHYLGALGMTGLTAYYGLVVVGEAKAGQKIVVSGAAGATGSMVVQIAKHIVGAKEIIGIAGSDEKCRWVESLGADKCINYKSPNFEQELTKACNDEVDLYFDNVGSEILDSMLLKMKQHGTVVACGALSSYDGQKPTLLKNYMHVIVMRLSIRGFIVIDFMDRARETQELFIKSFKEGKLKIDHNSETVVPAKFEEIPKTWRMLFSGGNQGKLLTKLV